MDDVGNSAPANWVGGLDNGAQVHLLISLWAKDSLDVLRALSAQHHHHRQMDAGDGEQRPLDAMLRAMGQRQRGAGARQRSGDQSSAQKNQPGAYRHHGCRVEGCANCYARKARVW